MFCTVIALATMPVAYVTNKLIDYLYPGKFDAYCVYYGWYVLEFCSRVELKAQHTYAYVKQYFPALNGKKEEEKSFITLVKDGEEISKYEFSEFMNLKETGKIIRGTYDFILYESSIINNEKYDKSIVRYNEHDDIIKIEYNALNEFNFNAMQFKFKDINTIYGINFDKNFFLMNGNILFDKPFLKWYLNKYNNVILQDIDKYSLSFIDNNMNYIVLTEEDYIVIKNKECIVKKSVISESAEDSNISLEEKKDQ